MNGATTKPWKTKPSGDGVSVAGVLLSHPDKVLFAEQGLTKRRLAEYYAAVAARMLPHLADRPLTLVRCPSGVGKTCFFQKHAREGIPRAVRRVVVPEKRGPATYLAVDDLRGLLSLVQVGVLEFHVWGARADDPERPDRLIFDLDPDPALPFAMVKEAAIEARDRLKALGLDSFVMTTGGKGLHVMAPLVRRHDWPRIKTFAEAFADAMMRDRPQLYVTNMAKDARQGKIFVDYLRNDRGSTAIAPYSTRSRETAPVAMPVRWEELPDVMAASQFTMANLGERLASPGDDPWAEMWRVRQSLGRQALRRLGLET